MSYRVLPALAVALLLAGCQNIGYRELPRDRHGFTQAIAASWKEQMLLNIVKVRYLDPPVYLDVSSVISSYTFETELGLTGIVFPHNRLESSRGIAATGRYGESPTVSYVPLTGERLVKSMHTPIPPETVLATVAGGARTDLILRATVQAINGIPNIASPPTRGRKRDARFMEVGERLGRIAESGSLSLRIEARENGGRTMVVLRPVDDESAEDVARLKTLLGLDAGRDSFFLSFGAARGKTDEIVMLTRTMQGVIGDLAAGVEVPPQDIAEGRATQHGQQSGNDEALIRVRYSVEQPTDAYAAVAYRGGWFWIDDRDLDSKRSFRFLAMFSSLAETGTTPQAPLLTIPAR